MKDELLGHRRKDWVAYLRAVHRRDVSRRYGGSDYDDGMCHGIIPFGATRHLLGEANRRLTDALSRPQAARVVGWDASGIALALVCPWCGVEHRHIVTEAWDPATALLAPCGKGAYHVAVTR